MATKVRDVLIVNPIEFLVTEPLLPEPVRREISVRAQEYRSFDAVHLRRFDDSNADQSIRDPQSADDCVGRGSSQKQEVSESVSELIEEFIEHHFDLH